MQLPLIQFSLKRISTVGPKSCGLVRLCQTRLIPRSPDGDNNFFWASLLKLPRTPRRLSGTFSYFLDKIMHGNLDAYVCHYGDIDEGI